MQHHKGMRILLLLVLLYTNSCAVFKKIDNLVEITGKVEIHTPYCGGAKPTPEVEKGTLSPYANQLFYVKTVMNNDKGKLTVTTFKTDENGLFSFKVKKGNYVILHEDKVLTFDAYKGKFSTTTERFLKYVGDEAAKQIYESADFALEANESKLMNFKYQSRCFSLMNPLLKYVGPLPR